MWNISQSWNHIFEMNCGPRSEVIISDTPKREIQKTKALTHSAAELSDKRMASIHLDARSVTVKMKLKPPLYSKGPTKSMRRWEKRHWGMGIGCGDRGAWRWILACWQWRQAHIQAVMSLGSPLQTNLEDTIRREASLPGCEILCKWEKMSLLNFSGIIVQKTPVETLPARPCVPA
jgi:hypothetical protein